MSGHDGNANDALVVPFIWVPDDAREPTEWLMRHPDAVRVPATFEQDKPSPSARRQQASRSDHPETKNGSSGNASVAGDQSNGSTWPRPNNPRRRPSAYWLTAAATGRTDPVEAYRQAAEGLPRADDAAERGPEPSATQPPAIPVELPSEIQAATPNPAAHANHVAAPGGGAISGQDAPTGIYPQSQSAIYDPADLRWSLREEPAGSTRPA